MLMTLKSCWETVFRTALGVFSLQLIPGTLKLQSKLLQMQMREAEVPNYFCAVCGRVCHPGAQAVCVGSISFSLWADRHVSGRWQCVGLGGLTPGGHWALNCMTWDIEDLEGH